MATKRKIGTSLRQSVSAEKQKITEGKEPVEKKALDVSDTVGKIESSEKVTSVGSKTKPATVNKSSLSPSDKATKAAAINQKSKLNSIDDQQQPKVTEEKIKNIFGENLDLKIFGTMPELNSIFEQLTTVSNKLTNLFLENLNSTNAQLGEYLKQLSTINSPTSLYDINIQFINKLKTNQQEIFAKNLEVFSILKKSGK